MKKLLFLLFLLPSLLMGQDQSLSFAGSNSIPVESLPFAFREYPLSPGTSLLVLDKPNVIPPFASASITITITDGAVTLVDFRDTLCIEWGYSGTDQSSAAKVAFLKQYLINYMVNSFAKAKQDAAAAAASAVAQQITIN